MTGEEYSDMMRRAAEQAIANPIPGHHETGPDGRRRWVPDKGAVMPGVADEPEVEGTTAAPSMPVRVSDEPDTERDSFYTLTPDEKKARLAQVHGALQFAHDTLWQCLSDQVRAEIQGEIMDTIVLLNQARRDHPNG